MPVDPSIIAAGISAAGAIGSTGLNLGISGKTNLRTRQHNEHMYDRQLRDSISMWNMQNEYNHPSSQMARLRDAGLNPNLIYGNGNITTADQPKSPNYPNYSPHTPQVDPGMVGDTVGRYYDVKIREAQLDNLRVQNTVMVEDQKLRQAQTMATLKSAGMSDAQTQKIMFDLGLAQELRPTSLEHAQEQLRKTTVETDTMLARNEREQLLNAQNLKEGVERILSMRLGRNKTHAEISEINERIKTMKLDQKLKEYEIDLNKKGIQKTDPLYLRGAAKIIQSIQDMFQGQKKGLLIPEKSPVNKWFKLF